MNLITAFRWLTPAEIAGGEGWQFTPRLQATLLTIYYILDGEEEDIMWTGDVACDGNHFVLASVSYVE